MIGFMGSFMCGGMWFVPLFFFIIMIFGGTTMFCRRRFFFTDVNRNSNITEDNNDPLAMLKSRYAKGEITKEEFERIKKDII